MWVWVWVWGWATEYALACCCCCCCTHIRILPHTLSPPNRGERGLASPNSDSQFQNSHQGTFQIAFPRSASYYLCSCDRGAGDRGSRDRWRDGHHGRAGRGGVCTSFQGSIIPAHGDGCGPCSRAQALDSYCTIYCCDCAKSPISPYGYVCTLTAGPDIGCWLVGEGLKSTTEEVKRRSALQCALRQAAPDLLHVTWVRDVSPRVVCTRTRRTGRHTRDMTALATTKTPSKHRILSLQAADETIGQALCIPTVRRAAVVAADQILLANHGRWRLR